MPGSHVPTLPPFCLDAEETRAWRGEQVSRREWKRQLTCEVPEPRIPWFADVLVRHLAPFRQALMVIDAVIFSEPPGLQALRRAAGEARPVHQAPGHVFQGDAQGVRRALEIVLSASIDVRVLFAPSNHALRADHDGYLTLFSTSPGWMADVARELAAGEVRFNRDWLAKMP